MSKEIRFGWIGETRRTALQTLVAGLIEDWARDWWAGFADGLVNVRAIEESTRSEKRTAPLLSTDDTGALAIHMGSKDFDIVGRHLAGVAGDGDIDLAQRIGEEGLTDLASRIRQRAGVTKATKLVKGVAALGLEHSRLGAFAVSAALGRMQFELAMDRRLTDRLSPPVVQRNASLVHRHNALDHAPLRVVAVMDFGSVDLAHLSDLSVGEILIGDCKLDEALKIQLQGHGGIATGYLRRLGEQRAVVLDGINVQEKTNHE
jgi:hypothetical protein